MRAVSLLVALTLTASPVLAQQPAPIRASIEKAAETAAQTPAQPMTSKASGQKSGLFWSGVALVVAGVTTSTLGLTVFRTESSSTGNAPANTYSSCVALKNSDPVYATSQCDGLKAKNLGLFVGRRGGRRPRRRADDHQPHQRGALARPHRLVSSPAFLNDLGFEPWRT